MDSNEEKKIINEILNQRRLSYSIEVLDIQGDKYISPREWRKMHKGK